MYIFLELNPVSQKLKHFAIWKYFALFFFITFKIFVLGLIHRIFVVMLEISIAFLA